jgi:radical SAM superfamily enzyme
MEIESNVKLYYRIDCLEDVLFKLPELADPIEGVWCTIGFKTTLNKTNRIIDKTDAAVITEITIDKLLERYIFQF